MLRASFWICPENVAVLYFAYGSNCNPAVMEVKGVRFRSRQPAMLADYCLRFNKKSLKPGVPAGVGFANLCPHSAGVVEGVLYELIPEDLPRLDASERHPEHYVRIPVAVRTEWEVVECFAYQARPDKTAPNLKPSQEYLNHLLAAEEFYSREYFRMLSDTEIDPTGS